MPHNLTTPVACIAAILPGLLLACTEAPSGATLERTAQAITGGVEVNSSEFPAVVLVRLLDVSQMCTGTLIAPDVVLTAGHCFDDYLSNNVEVRVGVTNSAVSGGDTFEIDHWVVHPNYQLTSFSIAHDVALVFLTTPVPGVTPVALARAAELATPAETGTMVGYGRPNIEGTSGVLRAAYDRPIATCDRVEEIIAEVTGGAVASYAEASFVCWERLEGIGKCRGDSGGPTLVDVAGALTIIGVASQSDATCEYYSIDAEVASELAFIDGELAAWQCDADGVCNGFCEDFDLPADADCTGQPCQGNGCPTDPGVEPGDDAAGCAVGGEQAADGWAFGWLLSFALVMVLARRRRDQRHG
ncbi:MAG: trypsin-like serine protease [Myxococcales bacterium]|nr:trypsin-like serine protease [Myxococcales bacterium]